MGKSGKHFKINALDAQQRQQWINTQQTYDAWRAAQTERRRRYIGSMRWAARHGTDYLLRKIGKAESSLGPRSAQTEASQKAFESGREQNKERLRGLASRLDELAPINVAMGLGRVPSIAARILREFDEQELLGEQLLVLGTNAVYAYEAVAGVQVQSGLLATEDMDLLYDARRHIGFAFKDLRANGIVGLLRKVDKSFTALRPRAYRASNRDGYLVDLIRPEAKDVFRDRCAAGLTDLADDLEGAAIFGLDWLINSPRLEAVAIDERGYPVRMVVIDPRAFALHKAWLSNRDDREPIKKTRDLEQAELVAIIASRYLRRRFDAPELSALPKALRDLAPVVMTFGAEPGSRPGRPNW